MISKVLILVVGLLVALGGLAITDSKPRSLNNVPQGGVNQSFRTNESTPCPTIRVECPGTKRVGETIVFKVVVSGGDPSVRPTYKWKVSPGQIRHGKNMATIMVSTDNVTTNEITGRVMVGGKYPNGCKLAQTLSAVCSVNLVKEQ